MIHLPGATHLIFLPMWNTTKNRQVKKSCLPEKTDYSPNSPQQRLCSFLKDVFTSPVIRSCGLVFHQKSRPLGRLPWIRDVRGCVCAWESFASAFWRHRLTSSKDERQGKRILKLDPKKSSKWQKSRAIYSTTVPVQNRHPVHYIDFFLRICRRVKFCKDFSHQNDQNILQI